MSGLGGQLPIPLFGELKSIENLVIINLCFPIFYCLPTHFSANLKYRKSRNYHFMLPYLLFAHPDYECFLRHS